MRTITLEEHFATPLYLDGPGKDLKNAAGKFEGRAKDFVWGRRHIGSTQVA